MKIFKYVHSFIIFAFICGCNSDNLDKQFNCNGVTVKFNNYERFFEIQGVELSNKKDFFMNQITIFGKLNENTIDETLVTFNKINNTLELKDPSRILYEDCIEIDDKKID
mgnify:FL=1